MLAMQAFNAKGHLSICTGVTIEARRASDLDNDQVRRDVFRLLVHLCWYESRMSAVIFWAVYGRFWQGQMLPHANRAPSALYANLAKALFARFYAKLLIPRLGT